jgi:hypothetical protein
MWTGIITWFNREHPHSSGGTKIVGSLRADKVVFEYTWEGTQYLANFDMRNGRGTARQVGSSRIHATFIGHSKMPSDDQIEMWGNAWVEGSDEYSWKADLGDY